MHQPYQYGFEGSSNGINGYFQNSLMINGNVNNISSSISKFLNPMFDEVKTDVKLTDSSMRLLYKNASKPLDFGSRCNRQTVIVFFTYNEPIIDVWFQRRRSIDIEREREKEKQVRDRLEKVIIVPVAVSHIWKTGTK